MPDEIKKSKIDGYVEDLRNDVSLNEVNLHDKSFEAPAIKVKWLTILHQEMAYLKKLEGADKSLVANACGQNPNKPRFSVENDLIASGKLKVLRDAIEEQKELVSLLKDMSNTVISQFGYDISSCIRLSQIENS
jgi:hypothetical protein